jgi:predicted NUDIX family NTP pyrophosphohydrolase
MPRRSAGVLLYRIGDGGLEVLVVHPGGPFWAKRDDGAWSIPKGEYTDDEDPRAAALREFEEELGTPPPDTDSIELGEVRQSGGKLVTAWALEGDLDAGAITSNTYKVQWPPRSGQWRSYPEVDRAGWFGPEAAKVKLLSAQAALVDRLVDELTARGRLP